jgi:hypothetical protein
MRVLGLERSTFRPLSARGAEFRGVLASRASEGLSAQRPNRMGGGIGLGSGYLESIE